MPSRQAEYENLVLNRRVEAASPFINAALWQACAGEPKDFTGLDIFAGLDLSQRGDMTALILAHCDATNGVWHVRPLFFVPEEGLYERAKADKARYDLWRTQGWLEVTPGATISLEFIADRLKDVFDDYRVSKVAFDKWNFEALRPWLLKAGFSEQTLKDKFVAFGQSYRSMSPALRDLEGKILEKKLRHGRHPVLTMNMANAVIETDALGNRRLAKKRARSDRRR
jgi:phage terminase large subunit-like protein